MSKSAIQSLSQQYPWMRMTPPAEHWYLMLAYIKHYNLPIFQEIERFNVTHIMLRGISLGMLVFALVLQVYLSVGIGTKAHTRAVACV